MQMTDRKGRHRMKTGKLKKKVLPVVIIYLILLLMAAVSCGRPGSKKNKLPEEDVTVISGADLKKVVNADGTVRCADPHYIYSAQALPVKSVLVCVPGVSGAGLKSSSKKRIRMRQTSPAGI